MEKKKTEKMRKCRRCKHCEDGICSMRKIPVDPDYLWEAPCFDEKKRKQKCQTCRQCKNCVKQKNSYWCAKFKRKLEKHTLTVPKDRKCFVNAKRQEQYAKPVQHLHCWACPHSVQREDFTWYCQVKESAVYKHDWCVLSPTTKPGKRVKAKHIEKFKEKEL